MYETLNYFAAMIFKPKPTKLFKFYVTAEIWHVTDIALCYG